MKTIFFSVLFFLAITLKAQISPILDHVWKLDNIDTGSTIIPADPNPLGSPENYQPIFSFVSNNVEYYYNYYAQCQYYLSFDDSNSQMYHHLEDCALATDEISQIAQYFNYTFIQQNTNINTTDFNNNYAPFGPLTYNFSTSGDIIYLHITNTIGEVATFYANNLSQDQFLKDAITIYPNPVSKVLNIKHAGIAIENMKIYDLNRRLIKEEKLDQRQIDLSQLQKGIYILSIETAVGVLREKLIKR